MVRGKSSNYDDLHQSHTLNRIDTSATVSILLKETLEVSIETLCVELDYYVLNDP